MLPQSKTHPPPTPIKNQRFISSEFMYNLPEFVFPKYFFFHRFLASLSSCRDLKHIHVVLDLTTPLMNTQEELQCSPSTWLLNEKPQKPQSITTKIQ